MQKTNSFLSTNDQEQPGPKPCKCNSISPCEKPQQRWDDSATDIRRREKSQWIGWSCSLQITSSSLYIYGDQVSLVGVSRREPNPYNILMLYTDIIHTELTCKKQIHSYPQTTKSNRGRSLTDRQPAWQTRQQFYRTQIFQVQVQYQTNANTPLFGITNFVTFFVSVILRGNAGKNQKYGIMGVIRFTWNWVYLKVPMRNSESQKHCFSSPPLREIMENKGFEV